MAFVFLGPSARKGKIFGNTRNCFTKIKSLPVIVQYGASRECMGIQMLVHTNLLSMVFTKSRPIIHGTSPPFEDSSLQLLVESPIPGGHIFTPLSCLNQENIFIQQFIQLLIVFINDFAIMNRIKWGTYHVLV